MLFSFLNKQGLCCWLESVCKSVSHRRWLCRGVWQLWDQHPVMLHRDIGEGLWVGEHNASTHKWDKLVHRTWTPFSDVPCTQCVLLKQSPPKQTKKKKLFCNCNLSLLYPKPSQRMDLLIQPKYKTPFTVAAVGLSGYSCLQQSHLFSPYWQIGTCIICFFRLMMI